MGHDTPRSQSPKPAADMLFLEQVAEVLLSDQPAAELSSSERDAAYGYIATRDTLHHADELPDDVMKKEHDMSEEIIAADATVAARLSAAERRALEPLTDTEILQHMRAGDARCFEILYERHFTTILNYLKSRTRGNEALSLDLTQDAFIRTYRYFQRGDITELASKTGHNSAVPWLTIIARNLLSDHHKRLRNKLEQPEDFTDCDSIARHEADPDPTPEEQVIKQFENRALKAILKQGISELNEVQREVIVVRFLEMLSVAEAAERLETNDNALKVRQHRACKSLRKWLTSKNLDENTLKSLTDQSA